MFEVKHFHQRQARFARLQKPLDLGGSIVDHFTKLKIPTRLLSSFNVPFTSALPQWWLLVEKPIRDIHITDRLSSWIKHAAVQSKFRNAAEQIVTRIDGLRAFNQRRDLMEIVEDRYGAGSTLITSQRAVPSSQICRKFVG